VHGQCRGEAKKRKTGGGEMGNLVVSKLPSVSMQTDEYAPYAYVMMIINFCS